MTPADVRSTIKAILIDVLDLPVGPSAIGDGAILFDGELGMDSVACIEILVEIEEAFDIRFDDEQIDIKLFQNVDSMAKAVEVHLAPPRGLQSDFRETC